MAAEDNIIFKTSTSKTIDNLFTWNKSNGAITAKTDEVPIIPGTIYFTSDGYIVYDLDSTHRLWMGKEAYSAIYAKDMADTGDLADVIRSHGYWANVPTAAAANDMTQPTFNTASFIASTGASKKATLSYNATNETLNFIFT